MRVEKVYVDKVDALKHLDSNLSRILPGVFIDQYLDFTFFLS